MQQDKKVFSDIARRLKEVSGGMRDRVPSKSEIIKIIENIRFVMFPEYFPGYDVTIRIGELYESLCTQIDIASSFTENKLDSEKMAMEILAGLPDIKGMLIKDITAIYEGDPAAVCPEEVIISYPGFLAISVYRIAHEFYKRKIPFIARMMTEYAHEKTGIDIHAGAEIGEYFFIDHGTGIVIGETTTIGDRVKIYQGVTLGAKSFELDSDGNPIKGVKRHPDIGNGVVIYANATILGGSTRIGDGAVIGGNVWLTHSVEPGKTVYYNN